MVQQRIGVMGWLKGQLMRRVHGMLTCREFEDFVAGYLNDELPANQRGRFEWHMRLCRECRQYLAAYRRAMEIGAAVLGPGSAPVPDEVPEDLIKAVLEARRI